MLTKDEYIQVINLSIAPPAEVWKNDPFEYLLKQIPKNIIEKYGDSLPEDLIPSTSDDVRTVNADARIQFSQILGGIYLDLAALLKSTRTTCTDEYQLLSLQDVAAIKKSFEFFILTGILPFLEPGVGLGAAARSTFIKSWKLYDGKKETCSEKLDFAAKVLVALLESNDALTVQFLPKFINDVLSVRFQLLELGINGHEDQFAEIFRKFQPDTYLSALMFLTQDRKPTKTPKWLKAACGRELTKILIATDGLTHLLQYYRERAGDNWTDNLPLTKQVAWHIATVPKMFKHPLQYHRVMSNNFLQTIWAQKIPDKNLINVFISYVEELRTRFSLNADLTVFDPILRFWEILNKKIAERTNTKDENIVDFSPNHLRNLQLLAQIQSSAELKRVRSLFSVLFGCVETVPYVKDILKASTESLANFGYTLYQYVMTPSHAIILKQKEMQSPKIQEIGGNGDVVGTGTIAQEMHLQGIEDPDQGVSRRLETVFYIIDNAISQAQMRTIMEMMSVGLDEFLKVSEKERDKEEARFVELSAIQQFSSYHAHLVVGCCFERLMQMCAQNGFTTEECMQLNRLAESILNNASGKFLRLAHRKRSVDVFVMSEFDKKEFLATRETAKMALPMISTIFLITQGSTRYSEMHMKGLEAMANFTKAADAFPCDDESFNAVVEESKQMLKGLNVDVNSVSAPPIPPRTDRRRYSQGDICTDLIEELHDDEPAIKGGTLMTIGKFFRNRSHLCPRLIDYGVYDMTRELLDDVDSYVYLAAINCLCEMALYDRRVFDALIKLYEELANSPDKSDQVVIRFSRLGEAVGKMFLQKGDISVTYVDKMANIFMKGMNENDAILRASSCGAFGNFFHAIRGRGADKYLQQLFRQLHNMIQADSSPNVRRAAVDLVRQCLSACSHDVFDILRENLLDLRREVHRLQRYDRDETVRLHAQLCIDELDAALQHNREQAERGFHRKLRF